MSAVKLPPVTVAVVAEAADAVPYVVLTAANEPLEVIAGTPGPLDKVAICPPIIKSLAEVSLGSFKYQVPVPEAP